MKKRFLKVLSVPFATVLSIPMLIIQSVIWIIKGNKSPWGVLADYFDWVDSK